jgi:TolB-like protein/tetratricopeptide (TPR) repeat protein
MSFFGEMKSRNVFKVAIVYLVVGWGLIQIADLIAPQMNLPEWTPRMVTFVVMIGFPVALVMAWALELTPEGVKKATGSNAPIYIFAAVIAGLSLYWYFDTSVETTIQTTRTTELSVPITAPAEETGPPSIAVIPFANMSMDDANEPFTVGIHDDLLTQLSKISSLKTISRTSVLRYRDSDKPIPEIAAELGVSSVLEGGVQRIGDQVRINVQLIDAVSDEHIWAETYDRELSAANIFGIQSEIAMSIADALKATLTDRDQQRLSAAPTENLGALDAYFMGKQIADIRSEENIKESIRFFELAIESDPEFALAHAGRASSWLLLPEYDADLDPETARNTAVESANRALELNPELPEALNVSGWIRLTQHYDWQGAEDFLNLAIEHHQSNLEALHWLSHVVSWQGRHEEALSIARKAVEVDPYSPLMLMNLSYIQMDAGLFDDSLATRDRTLQVKSDMHEQMRNMWLTYLRADRYEEARGALLTWARGTGRELEAAEELGQLLMQFKSGNSMVELNEKMLDRLSLGMENLGQVYAAAGDRENALRVLQQAVNERTGSRSVLSMKVNPLYDFIRDDPRFVELMEEVNLAP